jgi:NAD(P)-dependent dehydrogenase (short-subunit alcohol dehydrogenase family)
VQNSGIGQETVKQLSKLGYKKIILACRTIEKGEKTIKKIIANGYDSMYSVLVVDVTTKILRIRH